MCNNKFVCENCGKEHDGSYGSGRFCSNSCRHAYIGKQVKNRSHLIKIHNKKTAFFGKWKCCHCDFIAKTKNELKNHKHNIHPEFSCGLKGGGWNKGKSKENCYLIVKSIETRKNNYKEGKIILKRRVLSEQEKKNISDKLKKYFKEHPEKHVWKKVKSYQSVPCEIFKNFLIKNNVNFYPEYTDDAWIHNYSIDVAFPNKKIGIEINGNQHYTREGNLKNYFQIRHDYLVSEGWYIIEVLYLMVWNDDFKNKLLEEIRQKADFEFDYESMMQEHILKKIEKNKNEHTCSICGGYKKNKHSKICQKCNCVKWKNKPSKEELSKMIFEMPITKLSKKIGVSQQAITKLCKKYCIDRPGRGYWSKYKIK